MSDQPAGPLELKLTLRGAVFLGVGAFFDITTALPSRSSRPRPPSSGLGVLKGRVAGSALTRSGVQVLLIGGASAGIGYLIGNLVPRLFGS